VLAFLYSVLLTCLTPTTPILILLIAAVVVRWRAGLARLIATGALTGTFTWSCERGTIQGQLLLAPTDPPTIQALRLRAMPAQ